MSKSRPYCVFLPKTQFIVLKINHYIDIKLIFAVFDLKKDENDHGDYRNTIGQN